MGCEPSKQAGFIGSGGVEITAALHLFICNSLDSTLRTALASFYVSDTEGIRLGGF
jgi:hypothetical protein